jgi:magnesium-transporting ATPase (P-type)
MVTSVALGLVVAFEPHEADVMRRSPRAVDRPIVTTFGIWRILFVGAALVVYTLAMFFLMKGYGSSDGLARTAAVNAITLGQVLYLLNSRHLVDSSLSIRDHMSNPYLGYGIGAVVVLQLLFTYAPPFEWIFGNEPLPLWVWLWLILGGVAFFLVVELEKLVIRTNPSLRRAAQVGDEKGEVPAA